MRSTRPDDSAAAATIRAAPVQDAVSSLPQGTGTYAIVMRNEPEQVVRVGALGDVRLASPWLVYVGSALGPGGLRARLGRHIAGSPNRRWHIDHVRSAAPPVEAWWIEGEERLECAWAAALARRRGWRIEVPGFGSSDCRCDGHLLGAAARPGTSERIRLSRRQRIVGRVRVASGASPRSP